MTSVIVKGKYRTVSVSNIDIDSGIDSPSPATLSFCRKMSEKWKNTGRRNCSNLHNNLLTIEKKFHFQILLHFVTTIKTSHYFHKLLPFSTVMMFTTKKGINCEYELLCRNTTRHWSTFSCFFNLIPLVY